MRIDETILTVGDLAGLPEGSEVESAPGRIFTKCADGWYDLSRASMAANAYVLVGATVHHIGAEGEPLTVEQFKQRFATLAIGMAAAYSEAHVEAGRRMLAELGCDPTPPLRLGMWVHTGDRDLVARLPAGSMLGHGPGGRHNDYYYNGERLVPMTENNRRYVCLELLSVPPGPSVYQWPDPSLEEGRYLVEFKRRVWTTGWRYKVAGNGDGAEWCAAYEAILARVGLDASLVGEAPAAGTTAAIATGDGEFVDAAAQRALPQRAVIRWTSGSGQRTNLKVRDDAYLDGDNVCGTRTLYVGVKNRWSRNAVQNQVVYLPGEDMSIPVFSHEEMDLMPDETVIGGGWRTRWTKRGRDWWTLTGRRRRSADFTINHLVYIAIPGVNR
jgi:hypothetical protein